MGALNDLLMPKLGLTMTEEAAIIRELTRASVSYRSVIGTTVGIGSPVALYRERQRADPIRPPVHRP